MLMDLPSGDQTWQPEGSMRNASTIHGECSIATFDYQSLPNILSPQSTSNYDLMAVGEKKLHAFYMNSKKNAGTYKIVKVSRYQ